MDGVRNASSFLGHESPNNDRQQIPYWLQKMGIAIRWNLILKHDLQQVQPKVSDLEWQS